MLFVMTAIYVDDLRDIAAATGYKLPIWIYPFMYSQFHTKLIFILLMVLLFCNAPFTDRNQMFVFMRTGRSKWLCGQVLYIIFASAAYYLFMLMISLLLTVFSGELSFDWGKMLPALSTTNIGNEYGALPMDFSYYVIIFFKPVQAVWFTFLMSWLGGIFIGLTIFLLNLISGTRYIGVLVSSFFVVLSSAVENERGWEWLMWFSPISWTTLDNIDIGEFTKCPPFAYCVGVLGGLIVFLTAAVLIFGRKKSLDVKGE